MTKSIIKIAILVALGFIVVFFGLMSEPLDELSNAAWFGVFFWTKGLAALAGYGLYKLYPRWSKNDKLIAAYEKFSNKGLEK